MGGEKETETEPEELKDEQVQKDAMETEKESCSEEKLGEVEELQKNLERKESEVLWLKSEYDEKIAEMETRHKDREETLLTQIEEMKSSIPSQGTELKENQNNLSAFL